MTVSELGAHVGDTLRRVRRQRERVVVEDEGKPIAAVIPIEDLDLLEALEDRYDIDEADRAEAESAGQPTVPWRQVKAESHGRP